MPAAVRARAGEGARAVDRDRAGPRVGVLALQGDVREHAAVLEKMGCEVVEVRGPDELARVDGLVLPGGESTTMSLLIDAAGLREPLARRLAAGLPVLGTCAGMILLAREVLDGRPDQVRFGAIDIVVRRNAFGRQVDSFETDLEVSGLEGGPMHAVFIRAPAVVAVGPGVQVLARLARQPAGRQESGASGGGEAGAPVVCRQGKVVVAAFHPELAGDPRLHELLVGAIEGD
jgi:5'-phosphate synthase pdxT subunit